VYYWCTTTGVLLLVYYYWCTTNELDLVEEVAVDDETVQQEQLGVRLLTVGHQHLVRGRGLGRAGVGVRVRVLG
tara:strand:- start:162 stop:383 length:222 start_codon:yes stop_codon:yes gene_type:complete